MGRLFLALGAIFIAVGLALTFQDRLGPLWNLLSRLHLGRLPGDIVVVRENFRLYIPWVTCLVISAVVTLFFWLFRK